MSLPQDPGAASPGSVPRDLWPELRQHGHGVRCLPGALLWEPGHTRLHTMYVVATGLVRLYQPNYKGKAVTILAVGPGGIIGFHPELSRSPYATGAEALASCTLLALSEPQVKRWFSDQDRFRSWMMRDLDLHLMDTYVRLELEHTPAKERVARTLLALDAQALLAGVSRSQLADLTNLTVETVVRVLSAFLRDGTLGSTRFSNLKEGERHSLSDLLTAFEPLSLPYL